MALIIYGRLISRFPEIWMLWSFERLIDIGLSKIIILILEGGTLVDHICELIDGVVKEHG